LNYPIEDILHQHSGLLSRVASTYEASESIRQELYQEICIAVWQGMARYKGDASIKTYILRIAHNRCISHVSKEAKIAPSESFTEQTDTDFNHTDSEDDAAAMYASNLPTPEQTMLQSRQLEQLLAEIRQLKMPQRQVITLSLEGLSYQEIADITGVNSGNVGVMITRLKSELQRKLQDE